MYSHGESPHDSDYVLSGHSVKEIVSVEANAVALFGVAVPRPSVVLMCSSANSGFYGNRCSSKVSHKIILLGRGTILK